MSRGRPWSQADDDNLVRWRAEGLPFLRVCQRLGRTASAVRTRLQFFNERDRGVVLDEQTPYTYEQGTKFLERLREDGQLRTTSPQK